jgi:hypothetical protein
MTSNPTTDYLKPKVIALNHFILALSLTSLSVYHGQKGNVLEILNIDKTKHALSFFKDQVKEDKSPFTL